MKTFKECCTTILLSEKADGYAKAYAKAGLAFNADAHDYIRAQAMYILSNLAQWREPESRDVKLALRHYVKAKR